MTLEQHKEDQSKYYLSYPKLPALDMKLTNRDINDVEWANISNLSALDNLDNLILLRISWYDFWLHQVVQARKQALILILLLKKSLFLSMLLPPTYTIIFQTIKGIV